MDEEARLHGGGRGLRGSREAEDAVFDGIQKPAPGRRSLSRWLLVGVSAGVHIAVLAALVSMPTQRAPVETAVAVRLLPPRPAAAGLLAPPVRGLPPPRVRAPSTRASSVPVVAPSETRKTPAPPGGTRAAQSRRLAQPRQNQDTPPPPSPELEPSPPSPEPVPAEETMPVSRGPSGDGQVGAPESVVGGEPAAGVTAAVPAPEPIPARPADLAAVRVGIGRTLVYPALARRREWQGTVIVSFTLVADGTVVDLAVRRSSGYEALDEAALDAVRRAAPFPPTGLDVLVVIPVGFQLR